jgi:hypothetical protein
MEHNFKEIAVNKEQHFTKFQCKKCKATFFHYYKNEFVSDAMKRSNLNFNCNGKGKTIDNNILTGILL